MNKNYYSYQNLLDFYNEMPKITKNFTNHDKDDFYKIDYVDTLISQYIERENLYVMKEDTSFDKTLIYPDKLLAKLLSLEDDKIITTIELDLFIKSLFNYKKKKNNIKYVSTDPTICMICQDSVFQPCHFNIIDKTGITIKSCDSSIKNPCCLSCWTEYVYKNTTNNEINIKCIMRCCTSVIPDKKYRLYRKY
jgi:hypothetical protein